MYRDLLEVCSFLRTIKRLFSGPVVFKTHGWLMQDENNADLNVICETHKSSYRIKRQQQQKKLPASAESRTHTYMVENLVPYRFIH